MAWQAWKAKNYFNPRPRKEGDCGAKMDKEERKYFNPRPRKEGDDSKQAVKRNRYEYFNPRPRKEGDPWRRLRAIQESEFQSTPSQRGRQF